MSICRNCGAVAGLPSCMCFNKYGTFCETCHFAGTTEPPFRTTESEFNARNALYKTTGSIFDEE